MSCAHPFMIKNDRFSASTGSYIHYIPCGYCLNCRVDKQNELTHRCEYELINYKCGAFVTLTYDDPHIKENLVFNKNGIEATLKRDDLRKYMYRLRSNIKRRMPDNLLCNHHFKYLAVGEYGGDGQVFDRPHLHLLLFGLDFAVCKREIERAWQGRGMVKCLPILDGGIRYVLKYLDKQLHGSQARQKYDNNGLEQPFQVHSLGLGSNLYKSQVNYINQTLGMYRWKGRDIPIPAYYKNKYYTKSNQYLNLEKQKENYFLHNQKNPKNRYDLHDFNIRQALLREKNLNVQNHLHGRPIYDYKSINKQVLYSNLYIKKLVSKAELLQIPF